MNKQDLIGKVAEAAGLTRADSAGYKAVEALLLGRDHRGFAGRRRCPAGRLRQF